MYVHMYVVLRTVLKLNVERKEKDGHTFDLFRGWYARRRIASNTSLVHRDGNLVLLWQFPDRIGHKCSLRHVLRGTRYVHTASHIGECRHSNETRRVPCPGNNKTTDAPPLRRLPCPPPPGRPCPPRERAHLPQPVQAPGSFPFRPPRWRRCSRQ